MSEYNADYYQKNATRLKAAARARYREKFGGLKRGEKMKLEIPEKYVGPLREALESGTLSMPPGEQSRATREALEWLSEELRHV